MAKKLFYLVITGLLLVSVSQKLTLADNGLEHRVQQPRPIKLGTSGGNINDISRLYCCGGTLGALVTDDSFQYILSNNHVLAGTNIASPGEQIIQPGLIDRQCVQYPADTVAVVSDFVKIRFKKGKTAPINTIDAAIAQVVPGSVDPNGIILDIGQVNSATVEATIGQAVKKSGRTTGFTTGTVYSIDVTIDVGYSDQCGGAANKLARFENQILITPGGFSAGGDSGSLIVEDVNTKPRAVGLLFAGNDSYTVANPIDAVLAAFGVSMPGGSTPSTPKGTIAGTVTSKTDSGAVGGAEVIVDSGQSATTDVDGYYFISNVPVGEHSVEASAAGFKAQSKTAIVSENQQTTVVFALKPRKGRGKPSGKSLLRQAIRAKNRHEQNILQIPTVVGTGIGLSETARPVIEIYLEQDSTEARRRIPPALDKVPVRVVVTGPFEAF